jgi:hypothetical protein
MRERSRSGGVQQADPAPTVCGTSSGLLYGDERAGHSYAEGVERRFAGVKGNDCAATVTADAPRMSLDGLS